MNTDKSEKRDRRPLVPYSGDGWYELRDGTRTRIARDGDSLHNPDTESCAWWYLEGSYTGIWGAHHHKDMVRRLPDEEVPSGDVGEGDCQDCNGERTFVDKSGIRVVCPCVYEEVNLPAPISPKAQKTFPASNGEEYPAEWYGSIQPFYKSDPPKGHDLDIWCLNPITRVFVGTRHVWDGIRLLKEKKDGSGEYSGLRMDVHGWTLPPKAPSPSPEKREVWDEYRQDGANDGRQRFALSLSRNYPSKCAQDRYYGRTSSNYSVSCHDVKQDPDRYSALVAFILSNLPEGDG